MLQFSRIPLNIYILVFLSFCAVSTDLFDDCFNGKGVIACAKLSRDNLGSFVGELKVGSGFSAC